MGMFDELWVDCELLPVEHRGKWYQTKDLNNLLQRFFVAPNGQVYEEKELKTPVDLHLFINFYTNINGEWVEYTGKFTDGKLIAVKRENE